MSGKQVGRPPLNDGRKTTMIGVRMDPERLTELKELARENDEPLTHFAGQYLERLVEELLERKMIGASR